jgi:hypothetical protein
VTINIISRGIGMYAPEGRRGGEWSGIYERREIRKTDMVGGERVGGLHAKRSRHASCRSSIPFFSNSTTFFYFTAISYLILLSAFSFRHLGHLQTDNMSLQFVLVPWSLSVDKYWVVTPSPLVLRLRTSCTWSFLGGVYDSTSSSLSDLLS